MSRPDKAHDSDYGKDYHVLYTKYLFENHVLDFALLFLSSSSATTKLPEPCP